MSTHSAPLIEKLVAGLALSFALIVMASIISPSSSVAEHKSSTSDHHENAYSTDPHEGLASLGSLEGKRYVIEAYATEHGPRYSIYNISNHEVLSVLITSERVSNWYPEVNLSEIRFDSPTALMMVDPQSDLPSH
ncbi:MAG: hypothetical protein O7G85_00020 [Planctomycetota bacterium]|nr:hypothetical protein [Planctomycetota bacterium]